MSKLGKRLIKGLRDFIDAKKTGRPMKQSIVRRMKVKGNTVYARETFAAPIKEKRA